MVGRGHYRVAAECLDGVEDTGVVSSHKHVVESFGSLAVDALNHGHTADIGKGFAREARGSVAGRYYAYKSVRLHSQSVGVEISAAVFSSMARASGREALTRWG